MENPNDGIETLDLIVSAMKSHGAVLEEFMETIKALSELAITLDRKIDALALRVEVIESGIEEAAIESENG